VVDEDVEWEQYRVLDPIGAAPAEAEFWASDRGLRDIDPRRGGSRTGHTYRRDAEPPLDPPIYDDIPF
jgi:hypothetical protein